MVETLKEHVRLKVKYGSFSVRTARGDEPLERTAITQNNTCPVCERSDIVEKDKPSCKKMGKTVSGLLRQT